MNSLLRHVTQIARLAAPIGISRAGTLLLITVDTMMVGQASTTSLAHYAVGNIMALFLMLFGIGILVGTAVLTSQALGAGDKARIPTIWLASLLLALILGVAMAGLSFFGAPIYLLFGQSPEMAEGAGAMLRFAGLGVPGALLFVACSMFLEAHRMAWPGLLAMLLANLVNVIGNWWLIHGGFDLNPAEAAALSTSFARWLAAFLLIGYILVQRGKLHLDFTSTRGHVPATMIRMARIGLALGLAQGLESLAFGALTFFAGMLGETEAAAFAIIMNVIATMFMGAIGVGTATAVQVGNAIGAGNTPDARRAGWAGSLVVALYMGLGALVVFFFSDSVAQLYTDDAKILGYVAAALVISILIYIPDGLQAVLMSALRGAGDVWWPTLLHFWAFMGVMLPMTYYLAMMAGLELKGLIFGTALGVTVATGFLAIRFHIHTGREIRRL